MRFRVILRKIHFRSVEFGLAIGVGSRMAEPPIDPCDHDDYLSP